MGMKLPEMPLSDLMTFGILCLQFIEIDTRWHLRSSKFFVSVNLYYKKTTSL